MPRTLHGFSPGEGPCAVPPPAEEAAPSFHWTKDGGRGISLPNQAWRAPIFSLFSPSCGGALERGTRPPPHPLAAYPKWGAGWLTGLAGNAPTQQGGGPGGTSSLPLWHSALNPPGAFLLDRQAARSLFPGKREWGAESASPWGRKKCALRAQNRVRPRLRRGFISGQRPHLSLSRLRRQLPRQRAPRRRFREASGPGHPIPQSACGGQPPLHKGAL